MATNRIKEPVVTEEKAVESTPQKKTSRKKKLNLNRFFKIFGSFNRNQVVHYMPFILFSSFLIIIYISNSYYAERMIREIDKTKSDLKEKRAAYISVMSQLMYQSDQSEVAKLLQPYQVKESIEPAFKIFVTDSRKK